jgi:hypothetical protein
MKSCFDATSLLAAFCSKEADLQLARRQSESSKSSDCGGEMTAGTFRGCHVAADESILTKIFVILSHHLACISNFLHGWPSSLTGFLPSAAKRALLQHVCQGVEA